MQERNDRLVGESSALLEVQERVSQIAPLNKPVLIIGERGTGKEMVASRVHYLSERWDRDYLTLNCATISESLLDSELFGHEAGAFSGATRQHRGYFERANGGTLFLDELATTSTRVQEKILRVIEYGELVRLGSDKVIRVDVRLVAATNGDLPAMVKEGEFRADLLDRLAFDVITLPPLRARVDDIPLLAEFFAIGMIKELNREYFPGFSREAMVSLLSYSWPGNVRELKNVVERAIYRSIDPDEPISDIIFDPFASPFNPVGDDKLVSEGVGKSTDKTGTHRNSTDKMPSNRDFEILETDGMWGKFLSSNMDFKAFNEQREVDLIRSALKHAMYNQRKTAELLGMTYHQLRAHLRKYSISR